MIMKYSEVVGKNFFEMPSRIPGRKLMYYLDYQAHGKSRAADLFKKKGLKRWPKDKDIILFNKTFALIGVYIKSSDVQKFEECMEELERTAPFFCKGYKEARTKILDDIVVLKEA
jgi:hypothetical protein